VRAEGGDEGRMETSETWNRGIETRKDETLKEQDRSFADFVAEMGGCIAVSFSRGFAVTRINDGGWKIVAI